MSEQPNMMNEPDLDILAKYTVDQLDMLHRMVSKEFGELWMNSERRAQLKAIEDGELEMLITIADGVMDTANGRWIECTPSNIIEYGMASKSTFQTPEGFQQAIDLAYEAGYIPRMWIVSEEAGDVATSSNSDD